MIWLSYIFLINKLFLYWGIMPGWTLDCHHVISTWQIATLQYSMYSGVGYVSKPVFWRTHCVFAQIQAWSVGGHNINFTIPFLNKNNNLNKKLISSFIIHLRGVCFTEIRHESLNPQARIGFPFYTHHAIKLQYKCMATYSTHTVKSNLITIISNNLIKKWVIIILK